MDHSDAFVKVSFQEEANGDPLFQKWTGQSSAQHSLPDIYLAKVLQELYPNHSLVTTSDYRLQLLSFPGAYVQPLSPSELVTSKIFIPLPRNASPVPGVLADNVVFGGFKLAWSNYDFILYIAQYPTGFSRITQHFILHDGPDGPAKDLLLSAGIYQDQLHQEIWVFNQGFWAKDHSLWDAIQSASWDDVVLEDEFKTALQKDVYGFFSSKDTYKRLSLPWKRGLILYGPPGNGKTISIKVIMKTCDVKGYSPMYVKSFQSWMGEEASMAAVFAKARQNSPCVLILEDLDSLINDGNRSFFLNELDGLQNNDGLLVIGTTNHFDRLDPGLSTRPSRFDRKYLFDDPNRSSRLLYAQYWQDKLASSDDISYPDSLVGEIADMTQRFSFAYLKEAFVSALVVLLTDREDGKTTSFEDAIKSQIKTLRKQLDKSTFGPSGLTPTKYPGHTIAGSVLPPLNTPAVNQAGPSSMSGQDIRAFLHSLVQGPSNHIASGSDRSLDSEGRVRMVLDRIAQGADTFWL
ncbi:P-loop containing nucleoside triphosphate hydrolase protein [Dentipellis sp. KUC8613]|nr:P-loop containing nucleoside triphosphate hydrolase protein [Dentipellis sp. KUC8613]